MKNYFADFRKTNTVKNITIKTRAVVICTLELIVQKSGRFIKLIF